MPSLKPCLLERKVAAKVWGGEALQELFGIRQSAPEPVGETWELFDRPEGSSELRSGGTLRQLMQEDARSLLGRGVPTGFGGRFPLLFKFLDAAEALSVQVHPDDAQASAAGDGGKAEAWVVLRSTPRGRIIRGFRPGVTRERFAALAHTAEVESLLYAFRPEPGDCIHVPAGTVHAVGPGVVIFEVQQNSDITWRIWDWGRSRGLHLEQALAVARVEDGSRNATVPPRPLPDGGQLLVQTPHFRLRRYALARPTTVATNDAFLVVTVLAGRGMLGWHSGGEDLPLPLAAGDCALVPACVESAFLSPIGRLDLVLTDPGRV